jgi:hypothetical protein
LRHRDSYECQKDAYASGAAAYVGYGVTQRTANVNMYNSCMVAHGYTARSRRIKGMPTYMETIRYLGERGFELSGLYRWPATARSACSSPTA